MIPRLHRAWPLWVLCILLMASPANVGTTSLPRAEHNLKANAAPVDLLAQTQAATSEQGTAMLSRQPTAFVPNLGQWDGDFTHKARMGAMTVFLQERGWTFTLVEQKEMAPDPNDPTADRGVPTFEPGRGVAVGMHFNGAAPATSVQEDRLPGVHNYLLGNDPDRWWSSIPLHGAVLMAGLYPGIDARARSEGGHFEYDVLVEPGADLEQVVVKVEGADGLRLDPDGSLIIDTALGPVRQPLPKTWQVTASGEYQEVVCEYVLRGDHSFGFDSAERNLDLALVVDPGLVYSTYLGGSEDDHLVALALDSTGAATVGGHTYSTNFPTTAGAFDTSLNGGDDVFVTRLDPSGSALIYSTYLGGSLADHADALALDAAGAATVGGETYSTDFPTTAGAFDTTYHGGWDAFVARLNPSGSALVYSTYLGGSGFDALRALALDTTGAATVVGSTSSANFPTTAGAFDTTHNSGYDAFVTRLNPSGSALVYSTYLGSSDGDVARALALDPAGAATVGGATGSNFFPTTAGAFDTTFNGSPYGGLDAFVTRLDPSGSTLLYSTYLGGSYQDEARALAIDATGAATICGMTNSPNFPTTAGAFDTTRGTLDAFVTRLNPSGSALVYSTYLGGSDGEEAWALALDATGAVTVCGRTESPNFPTTVGAFDTTFNGAQYDAFVTRLNPAGSALIYSTYLGGAGDEIIYALALDASGAATVGGRTASTNFSTTAAAFDTTYNGGGYWGDGFVTRLDLGITIGVSQPQGPGGPITIDNGYLIPGNEYYNLFSLDLCPLGPGTGPYLGLCVTTLPNLQFLSEQAAIPLGTPLFHFTAPSPTAAWGPYSLPPMTVDAICLDMTAGPFASFSPVTRITIQ